MSRRVVASAGSHVNEQGKYLMFFLQALQRPRGNNVRVLAAHESSQDFAVGMFK